VLSGRGSLRLSGGLLSKLSPSAVQKSADDLLAGQTALTEEAITKKVQDAVPMGDFGFRILRVPLFVQDGILEIPHASLRGRESTVQLDALLDLSKMQADSTWQMSVGSDRRVRWPPVKVSISGALRELGARPRTLTADEFVRAVMVRKMEGDLTKLEGLNKPSAALPWSAAQQPAPKPRRKRTKDADGAPQSGDAAAPAQGSQTATPTPFEKRTRDALDAQGGTAL